MGKSAAVQLDESKDPINPNEPIYETPRDNSDKGGHEYEVGGKEGSDWAKIFALFKLYLISDLCLSRIKN